MIVEYIRDLRSQEFFDEDGGYRRLVDYVKRDLGFIVNHKRMYRICKENGLLLAKPKKKRTKRRICQPKTVDRPNTLWQFDIKFGWIAGLNRFFFVCAFVDVVSKDCVGYHMGLNCTAEDILRTLRLAMESQGIGKEDGLMIRSDNGTQMTSKKFSAGISELSVDHEFTPVRSPNNNAFVEAFFSLLENKCLANQWFLNYAEAYARVARFMEYYNEKRIHGSTRMIPVEMKEKWKKGEILDKAKYEIAC